MDEPRSNSSVVWIAAAVVTGGSLLAVGVVFALGRGDTLLVPIIAGLGLVVSCLAGVGLLLSGRKNRRTLRNHSA